MLETWDSLYYIKTFQQLSDENIHFFLRISVNIGINRCPHDSAKMKTQHINKKVYNIDIKTLYSFEMVFMLVDIWLHWVDIKYRSFLIVRRV